MKIINIKKKQIKKLKPFSIALGYFDGIHIGHQAIINKTIKFSKKEGLKSAVFTFSHSPKDLIRNSKNISNISGMQNNAMLLEEMGVDYMIILDATKEDLMSITDKEFVTEYLIKMGAKHVSCGKDFRFGKDKKGTPESITKYSNGEIKISIQNFVKRDNVKVSTRSIKQLLRENKVSSVKKMLGRDFSVLGKVSHGKKIGRGLGFKTANIKLVDEFSMELCGVFAVEVVHKGAVYQGVANVGYAPTVSNDLLEKKLEVFMFEFDKNIYNKKIRVNFKKFIRDERKFDSLEDLKLQIEKDVSFTRKYFKLV